MTTMGKHVDTGTGSELTEPLLIRQHDGTLVVQWPAEVAATYPVSTQIISEFVLIHNKLLSFQGVIDQLVSHFLTIADADLPPGVTPEMVAKDAVVLYERFRRSQ